MLGSTQQESTTDEACYPLPKKTASSYRTVSFGGRVCHRLAARTITMTTTSNNFKHDSTFPLGMALPLSLCGAQECPVWVFGLVLLRSGSTALLCFGSIVLELPSIRISVGTRVTPILSLPLVCCCSQEMP